MVQTIVADIVNQRNLSPVESSGVDQAEVGGIAGACAAVAIPIWSRSEESRSTAVPISETHVDS
jgi:hypothetical protein